MIRQLPLGITPNDTSRFDNFVAGENGPALQAVRACAEGREPTLVYLWSPLGGGRSHLLQAACHGAAQIGRTPLFLPLAWGSDLLPEVLEGARAMDLVCLDDLQAIAGDQEWERALFMLLNDVRDHGGSVIMTAESTPSAIGIALVDLASRLSAAAVFRLRPLRDADKSAVLRERARDRGIELPVEVRDYLLRHCPRDLGELLQLLDSLDKAALAAHRRITIPFVKDVLAGKAEGEGG